MKKCEEVFKEEIGYIDDDRIRTFVIDSMEELAPQYFWVAPASVSGKYHPFWDLGEGGIVRHTKVVVWYTLEFVRMIPIARDDIMRVNIGKQLYQDICVSSAILHDLQKFGEGYDGTTASLPENITRTHGIKFAEKLCAFAFPGSEPVPFVYKCIFRAITGHMGVWTSESKYYPENQTDEVLRNIARIVHYADYTASRKMPGFLEKIIDSQRKK